MYARQTVPDALLRLADLQSQVVTREQALGLGLNRSAVDRLVAAGAWRRFVDGVFHTLPIEPDWMARAWAGVLIGGDRARLGSSAAGFLHELVASPPGEITVLVDPERGRPRVQGWRFVREHPGLRRPSRSGSPPRISVEDTVLDLADEETDEQKIVGWVTAAVQSRRTNLPRLQRVAEGRRRLRHRALLNGLFEEVADGAQSTLEVRYLRDVERAHGLPAGRRQVRRGRTFCDVCYDRYGLLVELDGHLGHTGSGRFRDMDRDNSATSDGLATLRYGHVDVFGRPCEVAFQVGRNLNLRGWSGVATRCRRCIRVL